MDEATEQILLQDRRGPVAVLTLNRPSRKNALNLLLKRRLVDAIVALEADQTVTVIVLTGSNGIFAAGSDIAEMENMSPSDHVHGRTDEVFHVIRNAKKPVIAAVEGYALGGGCELALACDMIIAADDAQFGQPEILVGIMPGAGGTQRLLRAAGPYKTLLWALTGQKISAHQAYASNVISALVSPGDALSHSVQIGTAIANMPPLAVQSIREVIRLGADAPLGAALALERRYFERLFDTSDQKEGMRAFLEKRAPNFQGQ
jgi:enoyl-CoA hydratase